MANPATEIQRLVRAAVAQGWTAKRGRHWRLYPPPGSDAPVLTLPLTPRAGRSRALSNCRRDLERAGIRL